MRKIEAKCNKGNYKEMVKSQKGITLVALVITVIIIIILATVAINFAFGDNGLITQAEKARDMAANSTVQEEEAMNSMLSEIDRADGTVEPTSVYAKLYTNGTDDMLVLSSTDEYVENTEGYTLKEDYGDISGEHYYADMETQTVNIPSWIDLEAGRP